MSFDTISSGKIRADSGNSFSAIEIDGDGVLIRNAADETNSSGELVLAGSEEVLSSNRVSGTTINASYIKTGVLDANLIPRGSADGLYRRLHCGDCRLNRYWHR